MTALVVEAFYWLEHKPMFSGALIGACAFRFPIILPLALLLIAWRMWAVVRGLTVGALTSLLASVAVSGFHAQLDYIHLLQQRVGSLGHRPESYMPNVRGILLAMGTTHALPLIITSIAVIAVAALSGSRLDVEKKFLLAIGASCLTAYHFFLHDLSLMLLPLTCTIAAAKSRIAQLILMVLVLLPTTFLLAGKIWPSAFVSIAMFGLYVSQAVFAGVVFNRRHLGGTRDAPVT